MTEQDKQEFLKLAIEQGIIPRYLYKYREFNDNTDKIFKNSEIWFSKPKDFNDPFDCQIVSKNDNTIEEIKAFLLKNKSFQPKEILKSKNFKIEDWNKKTTQLISNFVNKCGISCFAEKNDNILMWSHYTKSHQGICIKFDLLADLNLFVLPLKVIYSDDYPEYNHLRDYPKIFEKLYQTKFTDWKYEEEVRIFKTHFGAVKFNKNAIVEVCFGVNSSSENVSKLKKVLTENEFKNVEFKKAHISKTKFELEIKKYN
jgi:hypothetical protein